MNSQPLRLLAIAGAFLLSNCSEPNPLEPEQRPTARSGEPPAHEAESEAIASGRAEILTVERHLSRRTHEGIERVQVSVTLPQLIGDEEGIGRINGYLRHLALAWPTLPRTGHDSLEEAEELMRTLAESAAAMGPEGWPAREGLESLGGLLPAGFFGEEGLVAYQEESAFSIRIVHLDAEQVALDLELRAAGGAVSHLYGGGMTLDLHTGEVTDFSAPHLPRSP